LTIPVVSFTSLFLTTFYFIIILLDPLSVPRDTE
jgi:hypothetical protein